MSQKLIRIMPQVLVSAGLLLLVLVLSTHSVHAQSSGSIGENQLEQLRLGIFDRGFLPALASIINFALFIAGVVAFLFVLYGGFLYLTAGGDTAAAGKGRTVIVNAIIGIVIIFLSYALTTFIVGRTTQNTGSVDFNPAAGTR